MVKPKWAKKLTQKDLRHLAEGSSTGKASIRSLKANLVEQRKHNIPCFACEDIARKLSISLPVSV